MNCPSTHTTFNYTSVEATLTLQEAGPYTFEMPVYYRKIISLVKYI